MAIGTKIGNNEDWRNIFDAHNNSVDAYDGAIGSTSLPTTAQTLTGAIAEQNQAITALNSKIANKLGFVPIGNVSTTTTKTLTTTANTRFYLFTFPLGGGDGSIHEVFASSSGAITNKTISNSSSLTFTSNSNNTVVIAGTTSANIAVYAIVFEGSVT